MAASSSLPPPLAFAPSAAPGADHDARLGRLSFRGQDPVDTPHYLGISSRGCVPHVTPDVMRSSTAIRGIYAALEDYAEHHPKPPPCASCPSPPADSPLRRFIALPQPALLVLGPRRTPPVPSAAPNTPTAISACTSVGFRQMEVSFYIEQSLRLRPDILVAPADLEQGAGRKPGLRRREKMDERTLAWVRGAAKIVSEERHKGGDAKLPALLAPMLPLEKELQGSYMSFLNEQEEGSDFDGVAVYADDSLPDIPSHLQKLPKFAFNEPTIPQQVLRSILLGADILTLPFITNASESGILLNFSFPPPSTSSTKLPLGVDMLSESHVTSLATLEENCTCYSCTNHHRAYLHHLLTAKEMLAWVLLQIHNHHVIDNFFAGIRQSLKNGTFAEDAAAFDRVYESEMTKFTGEGPRVRGYQKTSNGPTPGKLNKPGFQKLGARGDVPKENVSEKSTAKSGIAMNLDEFGFDELYK